MPLPSGMMWRHTPCFQFVARLLDSSTFWVTIVLCVDMLLVLSLGRTFRATGVRSVFNPACRTDNARLDHTPLDLVILWENKTGQAGAVVDKGLAYTLRSLEMHRLTKRARRIHVICPDAAPNFLDLQNPKLNVVLYSSLGIRRHQHQPLPTTIVELRLHTIPDLAEWFLVIPVARGFDHLPVLTRVIANLDLPYPWAAHQLPKKLDLYGMSPQDFTNAKASYDMLITTVSEPSATNRTVVVWIQHTDLVFGRGMQGVPGALEPREIPQTGRGVLVSGAPTPFLVRRCLLEELAPMLDGIFNSTILGPGMQPLDSQLHPGQLEGQSEQGQFEIDLKTVVMNYAIQRGQARQPSVTQARRLSCGGPDIAEISERRIRKALRKEKNRSKKRNEKARGKARFSGSKVEGDTSAVQLRGAGTKLIATQITEALQPNSAENSALALMTESEKTAYENSAVALSSEEKDALSEIQDALKTFRGRVAACKENDPTWLDLNAGGTTDGKREMAEWLEANYGQPSVFEKST